MEAYEKNIQKLVDNGVEVNDRDLAGRRTQGFYVAKAGQKPIIFINPGLSPREKKCILAEEAGHHYRTWGKIISLLGPRERKQERAGRAWAYEQIVPLDEIARKWLDGANTIWDLADELEVTEQFLIDAIDYYHQRYGEIAELPQGVYVQFDPYFVIYTQDECHGPDTVKYRKEK